MNSILIYKMTFPSGKVYYGQTRRSLEQRLSEHKNDNRKLTVLKRAINKYGWDSIKTSIIKKNLSIKEANKLEISLIKESKGNNYNMAEQGRHDKYDDPSYRMKISLAQKGKPRWSDEDKERIRKQVTGRKQSKECKEKKRDKSSKTWLYNNKKITDLFNYCKKHNLPYWTVRKSAVLLPL